MKNKQIEQKSCQWWMINEWSMNNLKNLDRDYNTKWIHSTLGSDILENIQQ